jgi:hypothetical protein
VRSRGCGANAASFKKTAGAFGALVPCQGACGGRELAFRDEELIAEDDPFAGGRDDAVGFERVIVLLRSRPDGIRRIITVANPVQSQLEFYYYGATIETESLQPTSTYTPNMTETVTPPAQPKSMIAWITAGVLAVALVAVAMIYNNTVRDKDAKAADLQAQLDQAKAGSTALQTQLDQAKAGSAKLQAQLKDATTKSSDLQAKLDQAQAQIAQLQAPPKKK